jgi:imidazolonepropionase-like amidohydrolase
MKRAIISVFVVICFAVGHLVAQDVAIRAGHVIDAATGSVSNDQVILIKDGKIAELGSRVTIPKGIQVIDLSRSWLMPGLIDAHTHITFTMPLGNPDVGAIYLSEGTGLRALYGAYTGKILLEAGFTTVRDVGNAGDYADVDLARAFASGWVEGPTVVPSGKIITPFGGQLHGVPPEQGPFWKYEYIDADTPDEIRKAVRRNIFYGAKVIKMVTDNSAYYYSVEEIRAAVTEAHNAGLPVSVHVYGGEPARNVILGGATSIEHGYLLTDDLLQLMKEKGMFLVGTDIPEDILKAMGYDDVIDGKTLAQHIVERLRSAYRIGVKMAFGTDLVSEIPGKTRADLAFEYLDVWFAAGVPPAAILKCMTVNAAELLNIQKERGSISVGLAADIIATPQNPLENIKVLKNISFVMKDGRVIKQMK